MIVYTNQFVQFNIFVANNFWAVCTLSESEKDGSEMALLVTVSCMIAS